MKNEETMSGAALDAFVKISRAVESVDRRILTHQPLPAGMNLTRFGILEALLHKGEMTHNEVARKILRTQGSISIAVDRLVKDGLVTRRRCDEDRRRVYLQLSAHGQAVATNAFAKMREAISSEFAVLELDELVELSRLCKKLGTGSG